MKLRISIALAAVLAAGALNLAAQPSEGPQIWLGGPGAPPPKGDLLYLNASGPIEAVKGAPYSAETVTEFTQVLADGNRIYRKQAGMVYRDSEGRTRRELTIGPIGPLPAGGESRQMIFINDPVAGANYVLDPVKKTAQKMPPSPRISHAAGGAVTSRVAVQVMEAGGANATVAGGPMIYRHVEVNSAAAGAGTPSQLGARAFGAVQADGTRSVMTIPAGQMGNERPIEVTDERWYSPQLQAMVLTRHSDPRMGDTVYQLNNITTGEPAHSLFEVPADYQLIDAPPPPPHK